MKSHKPKYRRILLKLSGEALGDAQSNGIDGPRVADMAAQIGEVRGLGGECGLFLDNADDVRSNYQAWAGVRIRM